MGRPENRKKFSSGSFLDWNEPELKKSFLKAFWEMFWTCKEEQKCGNFDHTQMFYILLKDVHIYQHLAWAFDRWISGWQSFYKIKATDKTLISSAAFVSVVISISKFSIAQVYQPWSSSHFHISGPIRSVLIWSKNPKSATMDSSLIL